MQVCARNSLLIMVVCGPLWLAGCSSARQGRAASEDAPPPPPAVMASLTPDSIAAAHAHYMAGVLAEFNGDSAVCEDEFSQALKLDPSNSDLALEFSQRLVEEKKLDLALEILQRSCAFPDASPALYSRLGLVCAAMGKNDDAEKACRAAIRLSQNDLEPYRTLFILKLGLGKPKEALAILNDATKSGGFDDAENLQLAEMHATLMRQAPSLKEQLKTTGLAVLLRDLDANPGDASFRMRLADALLRFGDTTNATRVYLGVLDNDDITLTARMECRDRLTGIYLQTGDLTNATIQLKAALRDDPANFRSYYLLGKIADESRRPEEALVYYRNALDAGGNRVGEIYNDLARVQLEVKKTDDALQTLAQERGHFPNTFMMEVLTALAYGQQHDYTNAVNHFTAAEVMARTADPTLLTAQFYFDEGSAYERLGNIDQAEVCLQKSIKMSPDNAEAMNYLGYMWAEKGIKLDQAEEMIQKALKTEPKSPAYLDSLGWVLYQEKKPADALKYIQQALAESPEPDATILEHLGDIFAALKQADKARDAWKRSLELESNPAIQKKLESAK